MLRIGVLVSGGGTNLQAILDQIAQGVLSNCQVVTVVASKPDIYALQRAEKNEIPSAVISRKQFETLEAYDHALIAHMKAHQVELVVLAGFLSLLGDSFVDAYKNAILNVHPSLIPSFCGKGYNGIVPHQKALEMGVKVTGATVHFVDREYDSGPIVFQKAVCILPGDTPEVLQQRVMAEAEWLLLPEAIRLFSMNQLKIEGRLVHVLEGTND